MARLVRHEHTGPYKIDPKTLPQDKMIFICGCGLSQNLPFCDGTHKTCRDEAPGTLYVYDIERRRVIRTVTDDAPADEQSGPQQSR